MTNGTGDARQAEIQARWKMFQDAHRDYDPSWIRSLLHRYGEFSPLLFGFTAVKEMLTLGFETCRVDLTETDCFDASETLRVSELAKLPIYQLALGLRAYSHYGLELPDVDGRDIHALGEEFDLGLFPGQWARDEELTQLLLARRARLKIDEPSGLEALLPEELAALAQVGRKSVINLLTPGGRGGLESGPDGLITRESALRWLLSRPSFLPTLKGGVAPEPTNIPSALDSEPVFVPVANDGNWFSPKHNREGTYRVANGDQEATFDEYWEALGFLCRAVVPRWRYRDAGGRWSSKVAHGWTRKTRAEIDSEMAAGSGNEKEY